MKATLSQYRGSPRKVRLVANMIKGKKVSIALAALSFVPKRAGLPIKKLLDSAISNAKQMGADIDTLIVKEVRVDGGVVMKRQMPMAFGKAFGIKKRTSHINILLGTNEGKVKNVSKTKAIAEKIEKTDKKPAVKKVVKKATAKKIATKN